MKCRAFLILLLASFLWACEEVNPVSVAFDPVAQYDEVSKQGPVMTRKGVEEVLNQLEKINFGDLPDEYRSYTWCDSAPFRPRLQKKAWYEVKKEDPLRFVVGRIRVRDFLSKDKYYPKVSEGLSIEESQYLCLDKRLLYKILELKQALESKGWNPEGFRVLRGHRNPKHNIEIGGKSRSRHIFGEAVDIKIEDLDGDGSFSEEEKQFVFELLDRKIIGNSGGVGKYPGTQVIHMDVRGFRARW